VNVGKSGDADAGVAALFKLSQQDSADRSDRLSPIFSVRLYTARERIRFEISNNPESLFFS
jgi:hypothetical protein